MCVIGAPENLLICTLYVEYLGLGYVERSIERGFWVPSFCRYVRVYVSAFVGAFDCQMTDYSEWEDEEEWEEEKGSKVLAGLGIKARPMPDCRNEVARLSARVVSLLYLKTNQMRNGRCSLKKKKGKCAFQIVDIFSRTDRLHPRYHMFSFREGIHAHVYTTSVHSAISPHLHDWSWFLVSHSNSRIASSVYTVASSMVPASTLTSCPLSLSTRLPA